MHKSFVPLIKFGLFHLIVLEKKKHDISIPGTVEFLFSWGIESGTFISYCIAGVMVFRLTLIQLNSHGQ